MKKLSNTGYNVRSFVVNIFLFFCEMYFFCFVVAACGLVNDVETTHDLY